MLFSSQLKKTAIHSLLLMLIVGLALLSSTILATHADGVLAKLPTNLKMVSTKPTLSCGAWNIVSSPNPYKNNTMNDVATISANDIWAIGSTYIEHWNGTQWKYISIPGIGRKALQSIAAISANDVWAVGTSTGSNYHQNTLTLHWDGTQWNTIPSPNVSPGDNQLHGVTALSSNDVWAVGYVSTRRSGVKTLTEHWDGTQWSIIPSPNLSSSSTNYNNLNEVAAVSTNDVWAVGEAGSHSEALIEHWDGAQWGVNSTLNSISVSELNDVAAISANDVWAVGSSGAFHWNGTQWSAISGSSGFLSGVVALSTSNVWAVGTSNNNSQALIQHWNGVQWSTIAGPNAGSFNVLNKVSSIPGMDEVWAVGYYSSNTSPYRSLAEMYC